MSYVAYKTFEVEPVPRQLVNGEWSLVVLIRKHTATGTNRNTYSAKETFKTKEEAINAALDFGQRIIDGEFDNLSVDCLL